MNLHTHKLTFIAAMVMGATAFSAAAAPDTASQDLIDARQETQIWTTYALSPHLNANDLKVSVDNGKATLTGKVEEDVSKDLAKQIALGVSGIKDVDNQIVVQADYVAPIQKMDRSYGEVIEDTTISSAVKSKLLWSKHTSGMAANVDTNRGRVTLTGAADNAAAKDFATQISTNTRGVVSVDNQLIVKPATAAGTSADESGSAIKESGKDISDSWITTKVKSTLMYSSNVDGGDIAVKTSKGIVTLSGKVDNRAERALAIELAKNVRGVKSVLSKGLTI